MKPSPLFYLVVAGTFLALQTASFAEDVERETDDIGREPTPSLVVLASLATFEPDKPADPVEVAGPESWFEDGRWSLQFLAGYYPASGLGSSGVPFAPGADGRILPDGRASLDLIPAIIRVGWSPNWTVLNDTCLQGRGEALLEYTAVAITRQFGTYFTGPSFLLRYNFERPDSCFVPYAQAGTGLVLNDAYHNMNQRLIGGPLEFLLQAQMGFHYFVTPVCSFDAEGGYVHISNADRYARNVGINNLGATIGLTYYFGRDDN